MQRKRRNRRRRVRQWTAWLRPIGDASWLSVGSFLDFEDLRVPPSDQLATLNVPIASCNEGSEDERRLLDAIIIDPDDEIELLAEIEVSVSLAINCAPISMSRFSTSILINLL